uniref:Ovule protein n=1 Tax=Strongyloides venezuelensis TaxID=75913 RepID=A0A0K0FLW1_STRVS
LIFLLLWHSEFILDFRTIICRVEFVLCFISTYLI